ncbi:hypothetical protein [Oceanobacillus polygoni]|uniref:Uncharacterized protein n=1 Tax=Oceanobacillus polygoni TaxID=1235259 RepID=A0A9X0YU83_9BACI|nr:hypothetical protein [Oceanobacillus polygoni]MBP2078171.1 hypothetical protein [Oceanobacillus polygoni]
MAAERIAIIVKEIKYWKEHRLLPETYCDYLLALYTNGEAFSEEVNNKGQWTLRIVIHLILSLLMVPFSLLVLYSTEFDSFLQLGILLLFFSYLIWITNYFRKNGHPYLHVPLIAGLLVMLLLTTFSANLILKSDLLQIMVLIGNFIYWLLISKQRKIKFLQITSVLAITFTLIYAGFINL